MAQVFMAGAGPVRQSLFVMVYITPTLPKAAPSGPHISMAACRVTSAKFQWGFYPSFVSYGTIRRRAPQLALRTSFWWIHELGRVAQILSNEHFYDSSDC